MSINHFLSNDNLRLLWDVIIENELVKNKNTDFLVQINNIMNQNINGFYENELKNNHNTSLIELNKKFIMLLINHIQKTFFKPNKQLITSEEIQTNRMNQFEKELTLKQQEFTNAMSLPVPPTPTFQDKIDEPISELELEIKRTIAQRNYDIEKIHNNININNVSGDPSSWLTSQETSIKKEKLNIANNLKSSINNKSIPPEIKYIKIENNLDNNILKNDIIDLNLRKNVQWADETEDIFETDLFKKLKVLPQTEMIKPEENLVQRIENMETKINKIEKMLEIITNNSNNNK